MKIMKRAIIHDKNSINDLYSGKKTLFPPSSNIQDQSLNEKEKRLETKENLPSHSSSQSPSSSIPIPSSISKKFVIIPDGGINIHLQLTITDHHQKRSNIERIVKSLSENQTNHFGRRDQDGESKKKRHMYIKPNSKSTSLNDHLDGLGGLLLKSLGLNESNISIPFQPSSLDAPVIICGRILCDTDGKLNEGSVMIECSRSIGSGCRISLDLSEAKGYSLFTSQIVILEGYNSNGGSKFKVIKQLKPPLLSIPSISSISPSLDFEMKSNLNENQENRDKNENEINNNLSNKNEKNQKSKRETNGNFSMLVASGPFTMDSNLDYGLLEGILEYTLTIKPSILLLLGPFIDSEHSLVQSGNLEKSPFAIFQESLLSKLYILTSKLSNIKVLIIPSLRDIEHDFVLPQEPFDLSLINDSNSNNGTNSNMNKRNVINPNILLLPNPTLINIEGWSIASSSVDGLFYMAQEEISRNPIQVGYSSDRIQRLCQHLIEQRIYFPLALVNTFHSSNLDSQGHFNSDINGNNFNQSIGNGNGNGNVMIGNNIPLTLPIDWARLDQLFIDINDNFHSASNCISTFTSTCSFTILPSLPDLLILPSILKNFVKQVGETIIVNPGQACKKQAFGTGALIAAIDGEIRINAIQF